MSRSHIWCLLFLLPMVSYRLAAGEERQGDSVRAVLRVDWTSPASSSWDGYIRVSQGRVTSARVLDPEGGRVRLVAADGEGTVRFRGEGAAARCCLEVSLEAPPCSRLECSLDGCAADTSLEEILAGTVLRLDAPGNWRVRRDPADIIKVGLNRPHLIFAPGETAEVGVEFWFLGAGSRTLSTQFQVAMRGARAGDWLFSTQTTLPVEVNPTNPVRRSVKVRMPTAEGVYDLVLRAEPEGLQAVERRVQFVVLSPEFTTGPAVTELETRVVEELDPATPNPAGPWYSTKRLRNRTTRLGRFLWTSVRHPFTGHDRTSEIPVASYTLNVQNPGLPHLVNIEYEDPGNLLLTASVSERPGDGTWMQTPMASAVRTGEKPPGSTSVHQLVFWPQTPSPDLSLSVENPAGLSVLKKIRLLELPRGLPSLDVPAQEADRRLLGLCLDNPQLWAGWGSSRLIDPTSGFLIDDWRTFWDSGAHLAEYAKFAGYNCVQVNVVGQGGALYPSRTIAANYRLDTGALADSAQDPMRKDVVELLLRLCQRQRLKLIAGVRIDGSISALDARIGSDDPQANGLLLVSREGKTRERLAGTSYQPEWRYNPLHPEVQAAMLDVVRELVERYAAQPAFEGILLDLAPASHLVLPGLDWGYDDATVARFARDTGVELPACGAADPARFAQRHQYLTTTLREPWTAWRCRQMSRFYEATLAELQRVKPRASVFLNLVVFTGSGAEEAREAMRAGRTIDEILRARGIDLRNWTAPRDLIVLRPFLASGTSLEGLQLNASRELDELLARLPGRGTLCIHEPEVLTGGGPRTATDKQASIENVSVPANRPGRLNLRHYAQSLSGGDCAAIFDGGPAVALGHELLQREFARVFRSLPAGPFSSIETLQPVVVRASRDSRDTLVYLVNDASYSVEVNLSFNGDPQSVLSYGPTGDRLSTQLAEHGLGTHLTLEPFQTTFLRMSGADSSVVQCNVTVPQSAERGLKVRFDRLMQAMAIMGSDASRTIDGLPPNGDFEISGEADQPANWSTDGDTDSLRLDSGTVHGGQHALRLSGQAGISTTSDQFIRPEGRNLAMNVWLRADRPGQRVRWFLTGSRDDEAIYQCYADVSLGPNWELKQFRARDLPEGQLDNIRVRFQLLEDGVIWVDDARVCALPISQDEKLAINRSVSAIFKAWKERRLSDFERLSEGYWPIYLVETVEASKKD